MLGSSRTFRVLVCFVIPFLGICVPAVLATTIIGLRAPDGFIIATDSKGVYTGTGIGGPTMVCKIFQAGSLYFAFSGLANDRNRDFFPDKIIANSFLTTDSFAHNLERMDRTLSDALATEMTRLKTEDPDNFAYNHRAGVDTLSVIAGAMVDGTPQMFVRGFQYVEFTSTMAVKRESCPGDGCPTGVLFFFAGETVVAQRMTAEFLQNNSASRNPVTELQNMGAAEIQAFPQTVGPPISILHVNKSGASWPSNGAGCPVVVTPSRP
jgi:hypothetical protein